MTHSRATRLRSPELWDTYRQGEKYILLCNVERAIASLFFYFSGTYVSPYDKSCRVHGSSCSGSVLGLWERVEKSVAMCGSKRMRVLGVLHPAFVYVCVCALGVWRESAGDA